VFRRNPCGDVSAGFGDQGSTGVSPYRGMGWDAKGACPRIANDTNGVRRGADEGKSA
jgi:hypothetical protein